MEDFGISGMEKFAEDSLQHYGIKGMKWGVRRTPEQLGHVKKAARQKADKYYKKKIKKYKERSARYANVGLLGQSDLSAMKAEAYARQYAHTKDYIKNRMSWETLKEENKAVGKAFIKDVVISSAVTAVALPTVGLAYFMVPLPGSVRRQYRATHKDGDTNGGQF